MSPERIYNSDIIYTFLIYYFIEDLSNPNLIPPIEKSQNLRWTYCQHMAAWLPHEKHYTEILKRIDQLTAAEVKKTDA